MLLTITTTYAPATDIGFLLHKNPTRCQSFELSFGKAYVLYPEATSERCTAALLLDVDPVGMVRGRRGSRTSGLLDQYVNDRPYVASSFMSVAIAKVFGTAMKGRCSQRPELVGHPIPLTVRIAVLPARGGEDVIRRLLEPLGYAVRVTPHVLDEQFEDWGPSPYFTVEIEKEARLQDVLTHLYVLIPVLDGYKHYYVSDAEVDNLLAKGEGWLAAHPERELIAKRYLKFQPSLARQALAQLAEEDDVVDGPGAEDDFEDAGGPHDQELRLNDARIGSVLSALRACGARRVIDVGCGEGRLLRELVQDRQFEEIAGMDVSVRSLEWASARLHLDRLPQALRERVKLFHGSLVYRDARLSGYDAAAVVEVIEHLDPRRLRAFERVLFECAAPGTVVLTTPNREYNVNWPNVGAGRLRHGDHRFEWTRAEFQEWAARVAAQHGYHVRFLPVGPDDPDVGAPTQMAVFARSTTDGQASEVSAHGQ